MMITILFNIVTTVVIIAIIATIIGLIIVLIIIHEVLSSTKYFQQAQEEAGDMTSRSAPSTGRGPPKEPARD